MQEFTNPPAMNSPYAMTTAGNYGEPEAPNAPKIGPLVPGTAGGLPQKPGLSVASNPLANSLRGKENTGTAASMYDNMPKASAYPPAFSLNSNENQQQGQDQQQPQNMARGGIAQAAQKTQQMGRGQDTMLVHMTPAEVNSLQGLALATGGSLTINPHTGLPEAGWLGKLLPTLLGAGLAFVPGLNALAAAGIVGGGQTLLTGDLSKGLMAGLGAYGGASLASALGAGTAFSGSTASGVGTGAGAGASTIGTPLSETALGQAANLAPTSETIAAQLAGNATGTIATPAVNLGSFGGQTAGQALASTGAGAGAGLGAAVPYNPADLNLLGSNYAARAAAAPVASTLAETPLSFVGDASLNTLQPITSNAASLAQNVPNFNENIFDKFASAARSGLGKGMASKYAPYAAGLGLLLNANEAFTKEYKPPEEEEYKYRGPYRQAPRRVSYPTESPMLSRDSSEFSYFDPVNPYPGVIGAEETGYATGGSVEKDYGFASPSATYTPTRTSMAPMGMPFFVGGKRGTPGSDQARAMAMMGPTTSLASIGPAVNAYRAQQIQGMPPQTMPGGKSGTFLGRIMAQNAAANAAKMGYAAQAPAAMQAPVRTPIPTPEQYTPAMGAAVAPRVDPFSQYMADTGFSDKLAQAAAGYGKAKGGKIHMDDGAFVVDARTVSELGNGSSNAGIDILSRLGGKPVRGPGDGVSDSVPAKIGGKQEARVARDEVIFSPQAVKRLGGAKKLYALMNKAHKARKKAKRGSDTRVARGLGAL